MAHKGTGRSNSKTSHDEIISTLKKNVEKLQFLLRTLIRENEKLKRQLHQSNAVALRPCELVRQFCETNDAERNDILVNVQRLCKTLKNLKKAGRLTL